MGWTRRAPAPASRIAGSGLQNQEHSMPHNTSRLEAVATIGIDIGKNTFHLVRGGRHKHAYTALALRLLCARRERPRCRAAEQRDELAALHSITSSPKEAARAV